MLLAPSDGAGEVEDVLLAFLALAILVPVVIGSVALAIGLLALSARNLSRGRPARALALARFAVDSSALATVLGATLGIWIALPGSGIEPSGGAAQLVALSGSGPVLLWMAIRVRRSASARVIAEEPGGAKNETGSPG